MLRQQYNSGEKEKKRKEATYIENCIVYAQPLKTIIRNKINKHFMSNEQNPDFNVLRRALEKQKSQVCYRSVDQGLIRLKGKKKQSMPIVIVLSCIFDVVPHNAGATSEIALPCRQPSNVAKVGNLTHLLTETAWMQKTLNSPWIVILSCQVCGNLLCIMLNISTHVIEYG